MTIIDIVKGWTDIFNKVFTQIFSGRWLITVGAIYCLVKLTATLCEQIKADKIIMEASTWVAIIMAILNTVASIVMFYFSKNRPQDALSGNVNVSGNGDVAIDVPPTTITDTTTTLPPK